MAGAPDHVRIETNLVGELFGKLRGKDCLPLVSNQAVRLAGARGYVFPDATVVCGKPEYIARQGIGCLRLLGLALPIHNGFQNPDFLYFASVQHGSRR